MIISKKHLLYADYLSLKRLANFLNLKKDIDKMSHRQLSRLIHWRLRRDEKIYNEKNH
jgi:hypothetical protein